MKARQQGFVFGLVTLMMLWSGIGCGNKFFDPAQIGRFRPTPAVNIILDSLGVAEEAPLAWEDADEPGPRDTVALYGDYALTVGDLVQIDIFELLVDGQVVSKNYIINESGKLSIPEVGIITVAGLTETQLEQTIRDILIPDILLNPTVSVTLLNSQWRQCSVVGDGVSRPGRFFIPRHNYRLVDALAEAGGVRQFNVSAIFVSRGTHREKTVAEEMGWQQTTRAGSQPSMGGLAVVEPSARELTTMAEFGAPEQLRTPRPTRSTSLQQERALLGMATPMTERLWAESQKIVGTRGVTASTLQEVLSPSAFGQAYPSAGSPTGSSATTQDQQIEWVFENNQWKPVTRRSTPAPATTSRAPVPQPSAPPTSMPPVQAQVPDSYMPIPRATAQTAVPPVTTDSSTRVEWVYQDNRWVPVAARPSVSPGVPTYEFGQSPDVQPLNGQTPAPTQGGWEAADEGRLIRVPKDRLMAGDPKYNLVIQPGDTIYVPVDVVGEFYVQGNVNQSGAINMTGRPMTLKMAIAAAGGLGSLAYPKKCEVVRRIGDKREEIVMVDLDKIASGEQPDFFIKPHDLINVGTHYSSRWRAVLRNSFRAAWGFGMVYDRNFADDKFGTGWPFSL